MPTTIDLVLDRKIAHHTPDQLHGLACSLLEGARADHQSAHKAFTVWPLRQSPTGQVLRLTLLGAGNQTGHPLTTRLRLGSQIFGVAERQDLYTPFEALFDTPPRSSVTLSFETPTYFSRNGRDLPLPDPVLVFGSLARRWNLYVPQHLRFDDDSVRALTKSIVLTDARIDVVAAKAAHRMHRAGFIGTASFEVIEKGRATEAILGVLSNSAEYLGVGAQTTRGFGVTLAVS